MTKAPDRIFGIIGNDLEELMMATLEVKDLHVAVTDEETKG